jgi:S1-C subfamily serine protease
MEGIEQSIMQVNADHIFTSYATPWSIIARQFSISSAFCIEHQGKLYIMTNAHCVENASYVKLRRRGITSLFLAKVIWIIYECDLALLTVDDATFWKDISPLKIIKRMPNKLDKVFVYGYPRGGNNISITKGIISRVANVMYTYAVEGIALQIDAAINPGNSGGPVINSNGDVIGVAFSGEIQGQNMGYIIPHLIIDFFLMSFSGHSTKLPNKSLKPPTFDGLCDLEIDIQSMNNGVLRNFIELPKDKTGVLITGINPLNISSKYLKEFDIILSINGHIVDNDGTMSLQSITESDSILDEIIPFENYINLLRSGEKIEFVLWRSGKQHKITFPLEAPKLNIPVLEYQIQPSYCIIIGMVFLPLTYMLIREKKRAGEYFYGLVEAAKTFEPTSSDEQIIILSTIFPTPLTEGFPGGNSILDSLGDEHIINMAHLVKVLNQLVKKSEMFLISFRNMSYMALINPADYKKYNKRIVRDNIGNNPSSNV